MSYVVVSRPYFQRQHPSNPLSNLEIFKPFRPSNSWNQQLDRHIVYPGSPDIEGWIYGRWVVDDSPVLGPFLTSDGGSICHFETVLPTFTKSITGTPTGKPP
ncbi:hypothetical protein PM082_006678 [Marasmius tenuissimus]|nr:hypothetical protein PM082_006678 [Marasmius tenuissimus]